MLADLDARDGKIEEAVAQYRGVVKDFPQAPVPAVRLLAVRLKNAPFILDEEATQLVDTLVTTHPEDPEILLTAAAAAATLPARRAESVTLYKLAQSTWRKRGNDARVAEIALILSKG